jgi:hypothetical protein
VWSVKRPLLALVAVLAVTGTVGASTGARSVTAPAAVTTLAFDGSRVAYSSGFAAGDCNRVRVWNLSTSGVTKLGRSTHCEQTSTGNGIAGLALAGTRAVWLHYVGGNFRDWSLFTASTSAPKPRLLRRITLDVEEPSPIVLGNGSGSRLGDMLPYAVDRTVVVLRANGARRFTWTAPARVTALSAAAGELAVASAGGTVTVLDATGRVLRDETYDGEISAVRITGSGIVAQHGRTVELRGAGGPRIIDLPARAILQDAAGERVYYVLRGAVHSRSVTTGVDRTLGAGTLVQAEGARVAIASGRRVTVLAR